MPRCFGWKYFDQSLGGNWACASTRYHSPSCLYWRCDSLLLYFGRPWRDPTWLSLRLTVLNSAGISLFYRDFCGWFGSLFFVLGVFCFLRLMNMICAACSHTMAASKGNATKSVSVCFLWFLFYVCSPYSCVMGFHLVSSFHAAWSNFSFWSVLTWCWGHILRYRPGLAPCQMCQHLQARLPSILSLDSLGHFAQHFGFCRQRTHGGCPSVLLTREAFCSSFIVGLAPITTACFLGH